MSETSRQDQGGCAKEDVRRRHLPALLGLTALAILLLGFSFWLFSARLASTVQAQGRVEVDKIRRLVQHPEGGVVEKLLVQSGDQVRQGQLLLSLDAQDLRSELAIVEAAYFELRANCARLVAERDGAKDITFPERLTSLAPERESVAHLVAGQNSLFHARTLSFVQEQAHITIQAREVTAQRDGIDAQIAALQRQADLIARELHMQQQLRDRGLAQESRLLALERESASIDGRLAALHAQRSLLQMQQGELMLAASRLVLQRQEAIEAELEKTRAQVVEMAEHERRLLRDITNRELRAPTDGIVHEVMISGERAVLRPAEPALSIIEQGRPLVVMARLAPISVDDVTPGQHAILRFPGLSGRNAAELSGELKRVSPNILSDRQTGASFYEIEITLDMAQLDLSHQMKLVPGMPAQVFLRSSDISPLRYLLSPFLDFFANRTTIPAIDSG